MKICFYDAAHRQFYIDQHRLAEQYSVRQDCYFDALVYLCGLCEDTRMHFHDLFRWERRGICLDALSRGWQTGTTRKITMLAFNLWNGFASENADDDAVSPDCVPDELFCCSFQRYFFEAIRLRFPEYGGMSTGTCVLEQRHL